MLVLPSNEIEKAASILKKGGVGAVPTDTVFGLVACVFDEKAIARVFNIKKRSGDKALPVLVDGWENLNRVAVGDNPKLECLAKTFWPGALTIVLPKQTKVPSIISGGLDTIAVRIPNYPRVLELIKLVGPLVGTSANISGKTGGQTHLEVAADLGEELDFVIMGECPGAIPSTVVDLCGYEPRILREGVVPSELIAKAISS